MKKLFNSILFIYSFACSALSLSAHASAEGTSHSVPEMRLTDILVSALYFIGVLLLIYLVLTLVSKWGKKHPEEENGEEEKDAGTEAESSAPEKEKEATSEKKEDDRHE